MYSINVKVPHGMLRALGPRIVNTNKNIDHLFLIVGTLLCISLGERWGGVGGWRQSTGEDRKGRRRGTECVEGRKEMEAREPGGGGG